MKVSGLLAGGALAALLASQLARAEAGPRGALECKYYIKSSRIIVEGRGTHDFMRPHAIEAGDGVWMLVYSKSDQHAPQSKDGTVHLRFSKNEGRTWSLEDVWIDGTLVEGVPKKARGALWSCYAIRFPNGDIVIYPVDITENYYNDFWTIRSTDNGRTWKRSDSTEITKLWGHFTVGNRLYLSHNNPSKLASPTTLLKYSDDNGHTWAPLGPGGVGVRGGAEGDAREGAIARVSDTTFLVLQRPEEPFLPAWLHRSDDSGHTWKPKRDIAAQLGEHTVSEPRSFHVDGRVVFGVRLQKGKTWSGQAIALVWTDDGETFGHLRLHDWVKEVGRVSVLERQDGDLYVTGYINPTPYGGENLHKSDIWEFVVGRSTSSGDEWKPDPLLGDYEGDWSREVRVWPRGLVAQVIPRGKGKYLVHLLPKFDQRCPPHAMVEARVNDGALMFDDGPWSGRIQGGQFTGKGRVQGKPAAFELKKVSRPSPRLGARPPEGAVVLFDGSGFDHWEGVGNGGRTQKITWKLVDGAMEAAPTLEEHGFAASIGTKRTFQDYHLHVEFRLPLFPEVIGQSRGNSGIIFENYAFHELQVLDSYGLPGYYDECGAIYTIAAPRVNVCRPPLEWQSYDVIYTGPHCDDEGNLLQPARITVDHNGKLIHNDLELPESPTAARQRREKPESREVGRIKLQNHGDPVQYRNIWLQELTMEQLADIRRQGVNRYLRSGHGRGE